MSSWAPPACPEGYETVRGARGWLVHERGAGERLARAGFGPDGGERLPASNIRGRGTLESLGGGKERWLVRRFRHGGWFRALGEHGFVQPARPFQELANACALAALRLPTARVVAARALKAVPFGWRLCLVSARIEGVRDGAELLEELRAGTLRAPSRAVLFHAAGELVGRMHTARFLHADLHPRNLLFDSEARAWVLDLDRGRFLAHMNEGVRRDNLRRLFRAVRRLEARGRDFLTRGDFRRFFKGYARGFGPGLDWRADWRAILRRHRARSPVHEVGWWLERLLGSGPRIRDGSASARDMKST